MLLLFHHDFALGPGRAGLAVLGPWPVFRSAFWSIAAFAPGFVIAIVFGPGLWFGPFGFAAFPDGFFHNPQGFVKA
jgi:hypothetical protein